MRYMYAWFLLLLIPIVIFLFSKKKSKSKKQTNQGDMYTDPHIAYTVNLNFPDNPRAQLLYEKEIRSHVGGPKLTEDELKELSKYVKGS